MKLVLALAAVVVLAACVEGGRPPCLCGFNWSPVCGKNGLTYGNQCEARCDASNGAMPTSAGACAPPPPPPCLCPLIEDPVCGTDGTVYPSPCDADCAGAIYGQC